MGTLEASSKVGQKQAQIETRTQRPKTTGVAHLKASNPEFDGKIGKIKANM